MSLKNKDTLSQKFLNVTIVHINCKSFFKTLKLISYNYANFSCGNDSLDKFIHLTPQTKFNFFLQFVTIWVSRTKKKRPLHIATSTHLPELVLVV